MQRRINREGAQAAARKRRKHSALLRDCGFLVMHLPDLSQCWVTIAMATRAYLPDQAFFEGQKPVKPRSNLISGLSCRQPVHHLTHLAWNINTFWIQAVKAMALKSTRCRSAYYARTAYRVPNAGITFKTRSKAAADGRPFIEALKDRFPPDHASKTRPTANACATGI